MYPSDSYCNTTDGSYQSAQAALAAIHAAQSAHSQQLTAEHEAGYNFGGYASGGGEYWHRKNALVYKPKSQTPQIRAQREKAYRRIESFWVYKNSVTFKRKPKTQPSKDILGNRNQIFKFSEQSKRKLQHLVQNSDVEFCSQFALTFHEQWPTDGKDLKRMFNAWLTLCRKHILNFKYVWILEFQERGAPHFHVYTNQPVSKSLRYFLALSWSRITQTITSQYCDYNLSKIKPEVFITSDRNQAEWCVYPPLKESDINKSKVKYKKIHVPEIFEIEQTSQFKFHDHDNNFIDWDMGGGAYLCKYLEKEQQKNVPGNFQNVGRFWGSSRGTVAEPIILDAAALDTNVINEETIKTSNQITRILGKLHERRLKEHGSNSRIRHGGQSANGSYLADAFKRLLSVYSGRESSMSEEMLDLHSRISMRTVNVPF